VHSHAHYDHCGGTRAIVELTGARTALGEADVDVVQTRPELSWGPEYGASDTMKFSVDRALKDGDVVSLGNVAIECVHIPGHTPGAMAFFFEVTDGGQTYTVGLHGAPGLNTLTDEYLERYNLPASRRQDYLASLEKLKARKVDIQLGAHPAQNHTLRRREAMSADHNPFIDANSWPRFLEVLETRARAAFGLA
jgi:metallo-beta-lactamase class B